MSWNKQWAAVLVALTMVATGIAQIANGQQQPPAPASPPAAPSVKAPDTAQPAEAEKEKVDPFEVPDGTPEQLIEYVQGLRNVRPESLDPDTVQQFRKRLLGAVLQAAEKILAQEAPEQIAMEALQLKVAALSALESLGDAQAAAALASLPADLEKQGKAKLAATAQTMLLTQRLQAAFGQPAEKLPALVDQIEKHLAKVSVGREEARLAMLTGRLCEMTGQQELALQAYEHLGKILAANPEEQIAELGELMSGTARRLKLPGNPMQLEGTTIGGKPLDWSQYKGKVVLVMFWATWCGPCRRELPEVLDNYQAYHERGFDVVGISVDRDKEALDTFLAEQKLPWTVVFDNAAGKKGMAFRYGVMSIPQTILVGRDGKVISTEVRGNELRKHLEKLIGPVESTESPASGPAQEG